MRLRAVARTLVYDRSEEKVLLVRTGGKDYWHVPGGGWEFERETLKECAAREVEEEAGIEVEVGKLLWLMEFDVTSELKNLESFFLAAPAGDKVLDAEHSDRGGFVEEARWFTHAELEGVTVYPAEVKIRLWEDLEEVIEDPDRFIG